MCECKRRFYNSLIIAIYHSCSSRDGIRQNEWNWERKGTRNDADIRGTFKAGRTPLLYLWLISRERVSNRAASYKLQPVRQAEAVVARLLGFLCTHGMTYLQFLASFPSAIPALSFFVFFPFKYMYNILT